MKDNKKINPNRRRGLVQCRVKVKEMQEIITKSLQYSDGNVSEFVREACLNYKPNKKVKVGK